MPEWANIVNLAIATGAAAGGGGMGFYITRWLFEFFAGRVDKRDALRDAKERKLDEATERLLKRLETEVNDLRARVDQVESELTECRKQHAEANAEVLNLKAIMQGYGDVKQEAQKIIALDKIGARS